MSSITLGIICGVVFGIIDVAIMIPMKVEDKRKKIESLVGAFIERFMLGFIIPNVSFGLHPIATGALFGLGLSLPTALIVRVYYPIIGIGIIGGIIIGVITNAVL
ncbi:MAG: hypothetical protein A2Z15_04540 [Chloroflexi bacterium RBG_16_50_11]|nr:MAG: hypothetical protein A2Z15_04540 [Chloroflexi bacterium RBG_16_50_11]